MTFSFGSPAFLWALPAAGLPWIFHWRGRGRGRRVDFSAVELVREAALGWSQDRFLRWLLLAIRVGILAATIFALAKPTLRFSQAGPGGPVTAIFLVDGSYSMQAASSGEAAFTRAKRYGETLARNFSSQDRVGLLFFSDRVESVVEPSSGTAAAMDALRRLTPTWRGTDLAPAVAKTREILGARGGRRLAVILTDGAKHGWEKLAPSVEDSITWLIVRCGAGNANAAVRAEAAGEPSGLRMTGRVTATAWGIQERPARAWTLASGGRVLARGTLPMLGGGGAVGFSAAAPGLGESVLEWSLEPDALPADDHWYGVVHRPELPRVLVINGAPSLSPVGDELYYLQPVLDAWSKEGAVFELAGRARLGADLAGWKAILLANPGPLSPFEERALAAFVQSGGGVFVACGDQGHPGEANWLPAGSSEAMDVEDRLRFTGQTAGPLELPDLPWEEVAVRHLAGLAPRSGSKVLLETGRRRPVLVASSDGKVVEFAATLDRDWTNLPATPAFPILIRSVLESAAGLRRDGGPTGGTVGKRLEIALPNAGTGKESLLAPDGSVSDVQWKNGRAALEDPALPGIYRWALPNGSEYSTAVNLESEEGNLTPIAPAEAADRLGNAEELPSADGLGRQWRGKPLAAAFGWAAAAFFVLETLLIFPWWRRPRPALALAAGLIAWAAVPRAAAEYPGDRFVFSQLRHANDWDPYPDWWAGGILPFLAQTTSVQAWPQRRELLATDPALFESPFVILAGRRDPELSDRDMDALREYLRNGGFLFVDDTAGASAGEFFRAASALPARLFPGAAWKPVPRDHALYRAFFLVKRAAGRRRVSDELLGLWQADRLVAVYSANDLMGALARDRLGQPLLPCEPDGEIQRAESRKLLINVILFSLTGTYKTDAVHQPFLLEKLRRP